MLDAKQGKLTIQQFGVTIPLFRMQNSNLRNAIFSPILPVGQLTHPIPLLHFSSQHMLIPPQHSANQPPGSPNGELLENVFALTQPRQRSSQFDNKISEIQQQPFVDDLPTTSYERQLHQLLQQFEDIFDTECVEPANVPEIHVDLKPEFQGKRFFRPEPLRSRKEQSIIDANARKLLEQGKAKLNPTSIHNLGQVIVPRYDKDGHTVEGREGLH